MSLPAGNCSRFSIIAWINDTLLLPLTKIEELGAGNVYCQLLDAAYPERVPLHKVKWDAKLQVDFLHNFKILVTAFEFLGIQKKIDIQRLAKAKYQDNLEFVQWLKSYIQQKIDSSYQPLKRRNYAKIHLGFANKTKFTLTLNNKENIDATSMKSSIKSNATVRSSVMSTSKSTVSILTVNNKANILNTNRQKFSNEKILKGDGMNDKKNTINNSFLTLSNKKGFELQKSARFTKNKSYAELHQNKQVVKNVEVIQSEAQQDEFF